MINLFTKPTNRFYSFITHCYESVKNTVKSYHAYASNYDAHQFKQYAVECNYGPFIVADVTQPMEKLVLQDNANTTSFSKLKKLFNCLTSSVIYGTFTAINSIRNGKIQIFVQKQPEKEMRGLGVDFSPFIERDPELDFQIKSARCMIRDSFLLKDKRTDFTWGFIESDLSVKFESTLLPMKPPRGLFKKTRK